MISGKLEILRGGDALDLTDLSHYVLEDYDGFGMPPQHRITERGPLQHGVSDRGYRLDPRLVQLVIKLRATNWADFYARRQELLDYLSPANDAPISLRFTQPDGTVRQLDGYCVDGPSFARKDSRQFQVQRVGIRFSAPDPAWYDPVRQSVMAVAGMGGTSFEFPLAVPWTFGGSVIDITTNVPYLGKWIEYPEIIMTGPLTDPIITHLETGDTLDFDGMVLTAGQTRTIDLHYGIKTVVDQAGANKISDLVPESDLATWHLQPGENNVYFTGTGADENTSIILRFYNRYLGI